MVMYFSTMLASQTLMSVNDIWNAYNELNSVLDGIIPAKLAYNEANRAGPQSPQLSR
jgi:hypothetical protein